MAKISIGDVAECEYGQGKVVAITREWIVIELESEKDKWPRDEAAIPITEAFIPIDPPEQALSQRSTTEIDTGTIGADN